MAPTKTLSNEGRACLTPLVNVTHVTKYRPSGKGSFYKLVDMQCASLWIKKATFRNVCGELAAVDL